MSIVLLLFKWVLYSSVLASVLAIVILLLKLFLRNRLGVKWHYYIWFFVLLRLCIPLAPQSSVSIFNLFSGVSNHAIVQNVIAGLNENQPLQMMQENSSYLAGILAAEGYPETAGKASAHDGSLYFKLAGLIWLTGMILTGLYILVSTLRFRNRLKNQRTCTDESIIKLVTFCKGALGLTSDIQVLYTDLVRSPAMFGFFHPILLLPPVIKEELSHDEQWYVVYHELAHLKRKDTLVNLFAGILQIIHWFNPLLWYSFRQMRQDCELACDGYVMWHIGTEERKKYGLTILRFLDIFKKPVRIYGMAGIMEEKNQIRKRIHMISMFKKSSYNWSVLSLVILVTLGFVLLTDAKAGTMKNTTQEITSASYEKTDSVNSMEKENGTMIEPEIVKKDSFKILGVAQRSGKSEDGNPMPIDCKSVWDRFEAGNYEEGIRPYISSPGYIGGFVDCYDGEYTYLMGCQVSDTASVPQGLSLKEIPANEYLVFRASPVPGNQSGEAIGKLVQYAHAVWLPRHDYITGTRDLAFFELYLPGETEGTVQAEIWMPISGKR